MYVSFISIRTKTEFIQSLEHLIKSKQFSAAFTIIQNTIDTQQSLDSVVIPPPFVTQFHKKVLRYALSQKEPNFVGNIFFSFLKVMCTNVCLFVLSRCSGYSYVRPSSTRMFAISVR